MVVADVSVRVAWPADAPGIAAVQLRAWQERYDGGAGLDADTLAAAWRQSLSRPPEARHRALVALAGAEVVGFALTGPNPDPDADPAADGEMTEFTVDPGATRAGHGSRLLQACVDTLAADGFTRAVSWADATDDVLRAFLTSAGWAPDGASRELADEAGTHVKQVRLHTALA
ncbi:GNAT family N-acetyltransferase [Nocardioides sp. WV_118_6]|uniref:GNAT family N-acetyltransferase n=1 Tax=Pimelobacter TaxID=2044 RepID=UPI001C046568|nr:MULTISPECIES: GNAT family N-acetyltransferase [Pimelobacter]MBU2696703.1 GNAT family N-acetyltransferase [Pimelobacter sp. 30-1]UUW87508.1 GNAT family N-acetyltransferase [Pimelobacter simplex]UUW97014.1 GNAT family N-acetyltransferase [Pimelobacter simplex]